MPKLAKEIQSKVLGVGRVRARCHEDERLCVLEVGRIPTWKANLVANELEKKGYSIVSTSVDSDGPADYATQIKATVKIGI